MGGWRTSLTRCPLALSLRFSGQTVAAASCNARIGDAKPGGSASEARTSRIFHFLPHSFPIIPHSSLSEALLLCFLTRLNQ